MKKAPRKSTRAVLRKEYDFSTGVRGKYAARFAEETNLVQLDADLVARFPDSDAVNRALRDLAEIADRRLAAPRRYTVPRRAPAAFAPDVLPSAA